MPLVGLETFWTSKRYLEYFCSFILRDTGGTPLYRQPIHYETDLKFRLPLGPAFFCHVIITVLIGYRLIASIYSHVMAKCNSHLLI